jgi:two-component system chemotaxis response regulator CheB
VIGASTGGPEAVGRLVGSLRPNLDVPIVLVQHMPEAFLGRFVERLADASPMPVEIAGNKQPVRPGRLIVAPGGVHLRMTTGLDMPMFKLEQGPPINGVCPAVDPLFADGARLWGHRCLAIVLTGMGRDGADGAQAVHDAGGLVWVQDRDSSVVWGMPKAVSQKEIHTLEASPEGLARSLNEIAPRQRLGVR